MDGKLIPNCTANSRVDAPFSFNCLASLACVIVSFALGPLSPLKSGLLPQATLSAMLSECDPTLKWLGLQQDGLSQECNKNPDSEDDFGAFNSMIPGFTKLKITRCA